MTNQQEIHLNKIKQDFSNEVDTKYRRGQEEHGGNLFEKDCIPALGEEVIDLVTYFNVVREHHEEVKTAVQSLAYIANATPNLDPKVWAAICKIVKLLHL